jgi:hypothetical protein
MSLFAHSWKNRAELGNQYCLGNNIKASITPRKYQLRLYNCCL